MDTSGAGESYCLKEVLPNSGGQYLSYQKHRVETPRYTTINLNQVADDDNYKQLTYLINGSALAHLDTRLKYTNILKKVFNHELF